MTCENPARRKLMRNPTQNRRNAGSRRFAVTLCRTMELEKWAWVELNYRPHAYQAAPSGSQIPITPWIIRRFSTICTESATGNPRISRQELAPEVAPGSEDCLKSLFPKWAARA